MLDEFIYGHQIYRIRRELNLDVSDEEVVLFKNLDVAQAFFWDVAQDRFARKDLMNAAKWAGLSDMKSSNPNDAEIVQRTFEQLCLKIWAGDLLLVEVKAKPIIRFKKCCIQSIDAINMIIRNANPLHKTLFISKVALLFTSHPRGGKLLGEVSTAVNLSGVNLSDINALDWKSLAKAMLSVRDLTRKSAFKKAQLEARVNHAKDNNRELVFFWEGVMDAFA